MTTASRPPIAHLVLGAVLAVAFLIGGSVRFEAWGSVPVRPLVAYLAVGVLLHAASRFTPDHGLVLRGVAWTLVALVPLHLRTLLRVEVLVPLAALALVDLAQYRSSFGVEAEIPAGSRGKAVAGVATIAGLVALAALVPLARSASILLRLGFVTVVTWALVSLFALRPTARSPAMLLAAAGAFAVTFGLLAGPVVPLGPLMTYWAAIVAVSAAVLTATFSRSETALRDEHRAHEQTVRSLPDPLMAPLAERVHDVVAGEEDLESLTGRIERARGGTEGGRRVEHRVRALRDSGVPALQARRRALAEELDVDVDDVGGLP